MIKTFFKIKSILTTAVLMMLCFMGAKSCSEDYFNGNDEAKIAQYEAMLRDNTIVDAFVQDEYTETTVAKAAKIYTYTYNYYIDEVEYSKEITNNVFPPKEVIQLYYSKSNPSLTAEDPKQGIKAESEKSSINNLIWAIVFGLLAIIFLMSLISQIFGKNKEEETDEVIEV